MTKGLSKFLLVFIWSNSLFGQATKIDSAGKFVYEICVFRKAKPGRIIKNETFGIGDTTVAFVSGQVREMDEPIGYAIVSFTNSAGQVFGTMTNESGKYEIALNKESDTVSFFALAYNELKIDKLKLGTGQMQEITVDLGAGGGFETFKVTFDHKPTEKELKIAEKDLTGD